MSGSNQTASHARALWRQRRQLPPGWRIVEGMASTARQVDPILEQTRELARMLFRSCITSTEVHWYRSGARARAAWLEHALLSKDVALCGIIDRMDEETFDGHWSELVRLLEVRGAPDMVTWLDQQAGREPG